MKKRFLIVTALTALYAPFTFAQGPNTNPPSPPTPAQIVANRVARLTAILSLTAEQQTEATTIFTNEQTTVSNLFASMRTARTALKTAVTSNDQAAIATQATQIGNLTTQQVQAQAIADASFYAILTADQQTRYNSLQPAGPGGAAGIPGGGPGGFGRPGPGAPGR
jgi:Spy/CpxP family protein refolding chaperone